MLFSFTSKLHNFIIFYIDILIKCIKKVNRIYMSIEVSCILYEKVNK
jgi:hypothetical protein